MISKSDLDNLFRSINDGSVRLTALGCHPDNHGLICYRADNEWWIRVFSGVGPLGGSLKYIDEVVAPSGERLGFEAIEFLSNEYPFSSDTLDPEIDPDEVEEERWGFSVWLGNTKDFPVEENPVSTPWNQEARGAVAGKS